MISNINPLLFHALANFTTLYSFYLLNVNPYLTNRYSYELITVINYLIRSAYMMLNGKMLDIQIVTFEVVSFFVYLILFTVAGIQVYLLTQLTKKCSYNSSYVSIFLAFFGICLVGIFRFYTGGGNCGFFAYSCRYSWHWERNSYGHLIAVHDIRNTQGKVVPTQLRGCKYHGKLDEFDVIVMKIEGVRILSDRKLNREYVFPDGSILHVEKNRQPIYFNIKPFSFELSDKVSNLLYQGTSCKQSFKEQIFVYDNSGSD